MATEKFVVIGGVAAGMSAASRAKRNKPGMAVMVLERGSFVSYGSCGLPYFVSDLVKDVQGLVVYDAAFFKEERGIDVLTRHEVARIDPQSKVVFARNLEEGDEITLSYDRLAICTGASPTRPELPGFDLVPADPAPLRGETRASARDGAFCRFSACLPRLPVFSRLAS